MTILGVVEKSWFRMNLLGLLTDTLVRDSLSQYQARWQSIMASTVTNEVQCKLHIIFLSNCPLFRVDQDLARTDFQSNSNDHPKRPLQFPLD